MKTYYAIIYYSLQIPTVINANTEKEALDKISRSDPDLDYDVSYVGLDDFQELLPDKAINISIDTNDENTPDSKLAFYPEAIL